MRLVTYSTSGDDTRRPGMVEDDRVIDLGSVVASISGLIEGGPQALALAAAQRDVAPAHLLAEARLHAPLERPAQYRDGMLFHQHIRQSMAGVAVLRARASGEHDAIAKAEAAHAAALAGGGEVAPVHRQIPVYYKGNRFAFSGPGEVVTFPPGCTMMDFELELALVVGRGGRDIDPADALDHLFGVTILNDLSARDLQAQEAPGLLGPAKGKDFDKANVTGPWIVTMDEIGDLYDLRMEARVNGETWCSGHSSSVSWRFEDFIARVSAHETLHPGEMLGSGTVGNGCGLEHLRFLADGDVVELEIERIGVLRTTVASGG